MLLGFRPEKVSHYFFLLSCFKKILYMYTCMLNEVIICSTATENEQCIVNTLILRFSNVSLTLFKSCFGSNLAAICSNS